MKSFRDLVAWQRSIQLVEFLYIATTRFPAEERFGLTSQMRRAAVSIPSNIEEGQGRMTIGEWLQFLGQARGSLFELSTHITIAERLDLFTDEEAAELQRLISGTASALAGLIKYVRKVKLRHPTTQQPNNPTTDST
jgi:four helix bundle protein